jgi:L-rhamnose mutarotase
MTAKPTGILMRLKPGAAEEYRRRHDAVWPELTELLKDAGIRDYSIHLDPVDQLTIASPERHEMLAQEPIMRRWWDSMKDLMETGPDNRPITWPLNLMFEMK